MTPLSEALIFPTLPGQALQVLSRAAPESCGEKGEHSKRRGSRALYALACGIGQLQDQQGTAHGRPRLPTITDATAGIALERMRAIDEYLLFRHSEASGNG